MSNNNTIVYIGDFDFRNENVQSHLVKNNARILTSIGYDVRYIGIDKTNTDFNSLDTVKPDNNGYLELPNTLNVAGWFKRKTVCKKIIAQLEEIDREKKISHIITYQSPTYAVVLKTIAVWCKNNRVAYIVNCADLPVFDSQPLVRRVVMKWNWRTIHQINKQRADGIIAVSRYIEAFYSKRGQKSIVVPPLFDENAYQWNVTTRNGVVSFIYAGTPFINLNKRVNPKGMKDRLDKIVDLFLALTEKGIAFAFQIVGITKEEYTVAVPRHKKVLETNDQIRFLGRLSHIQTLELVSNADYSINFRDLNEMTKAGFSTKIVESISVGTPIISNDVGDVSLYLEEGVSWIRLTGDNQKDCKQLADLTFLSAEERTKNKAVTKQKRVFSIDRYIQTMKTFLLDTVKTD